MGTFTQKYPEIFLKVEQELYLSFRAKGSSLILGAGRIVAMQTLACFSDVLPQGPQTSNPLPAATTFLAVL